jgi:hypothetical protein
VQLDHIQHSLVSDAEVVYYRFYIRLICHRKVSEW